MFVSEASNSAVVHTLCFKTVCGSKWLHEYLDSIESGTEQTKYKKDIYRSALMIVKQIFISVCKITW